LGPHLFDTSTLTLYDLFVSLLLSCSRSPTRALYC